MNFFNAKNEFFVIDSDNLNNTTSKLYGYSIQKTGIYDAESFTKEQVDGLDGHGCYIYVDVTDDAINIHQDFNGCYGLYLYRKDDYFAISNSFFRLVEYVKKIGEISLNRDYLNHLIYFPLESDSVSFTPINEIELIDRNAVVNIEKKWKKLYIQPITPIDHKYSIDSAEGIRVLDEWFCYWTDLFRELNKQTKFLSIDLSGGYDSRLSFLLMLKSGADINDGLHTHSEDYEIASKIAEVYNFSLNKNFPSNSCLNYSLKDAMSIEFYSKLGFHKEPYIQNRKYENKIFHVVGGAGEAIRATRFDKKKQEFLEMMSVAARVYPTKLAKDLSDSFKRLMESDFEIIHEKYGAEDEMPYPYGHYLLRDTQCRSHFGKISLVNYFSNRFILAPLMDQKLWSLELSCDAAKDNNFLMALIYQRYCPQLLEFPFEGKRYFLSPETIECAKSINQKYPLQAKDESEFMNFRINCIDGDIERYKNNNNNVLKGDEVTSYLKKIFDSAYVKGLFTTEFDEYIYHRAARYFPSTKFFPIRHCYSVLTTTKMIECVIESKVSNDSVVGLFSESRVDVAAKDVWEFVDRIRDYFTARIDIEFIGKNDKPIQEVTVSDDMARVYQPEFLKKNDGYVIASYAGEIDIYVKIKHEGKMNIVLRGLDIRVPDDRSKRIAYWVDYTKLAVNDVDVLEDTFPSWHDKPYRHVLDVKEPGQIHLKVCWKPHQDNLVVNV